MGEGDKICDTLGKGKSNDLYFHFCIHVDDPKDYEHRFAMSALVPSSVFHGDDVFLRGRGYLV